MCKAETAWVRFELTERFPVRRFSRPLHSTTLPPRLGPKTLRPTRLMQEASSTFWGPAHQQIYVPQELRLPRYPRDDTWPVLRRLT